MKKKKEEKVIKLNEYEAKENKIVNKNNLNSMYRSIDRSFLEYLNASDRCERHVYRDLVDGQSFALFSLHLLPDGVSYTDIVNCL